MVKKDWQRTVCNWNVDSLQIRQFASALLESRIWTRPFWYFWTSSKETVPYCPDCPLWGIDDPFTLGIVIVHPYCSYDMNHIMQFLLVSIVFGIWHFMLIDCITFRLGVRTLQGQIRLQWDHIHKLVLDSESEKLKTPKMKKPLIDFKMVQWSQFWIAFEYRWKKYWSTWCISLVVGVVLYSKSTVTVVSTYIINSFLRQFLFRSFWLIF